MFDEESFVLRSYQNDNYAAPVPAQSNSGYNSGGYGSGGYGYSSGSQGYENDAYRY